MGGWELFWVFGVVCIYLDGQMDGWVGGRVDGMLWIGDGLGSQTYITSILYRQSIFNLFILFSSLKFLIFYRGRYI